MDQHPRPRTLTRRGLVVAAAALGTALALPRLRATAAAGAPPAATRRYPVSFTDAEWKRRLTPTQYSILRQAGTEIAGTSPLLAEHRTGTFACAACRQRLYASATKFDSGTGWPSFYAPLPHAIETVADDSLLMQRTEVRCARCGGHLGHVFDDGPPPTGKRYCMNGFAMIFQPQHA